MTRLAPLDPGLHLALRVHPGHGLAPEDHANICPVVTAEFSALVTDYPVFLAQEAETGAFNAVVLMGFDEGENLFLDGGGWLAGHKPLNLQRQPFYAHDSGNGTALYVDLDSPRAGTRGERLFDDDGQPSPYLDHVRSVLAELLAGLETTRAFIARLLDLNLVEQARLAFPFEDGERRLDGLYSLRPGGLDDLPDDVALSLLRAGDIELMHLMAASLGHLPALARRRQARLDGTRPTAARTG